MPHNVSPKDVQWVLQEVLRRSKLSVQELATKAKLDRATLYRYLSYEEANGGGSRSFQPRPSTIAKIESIAREYGIIPPWLQKQLPLNLRWTNLIYQTESTRRVPVIGRIKAGEFVLADENIEGYIDLPVSISGTQGNIYVLRVEGDSMIDAGFQHGDYVIVDYDGVPQNGDIVVVINEASEGTLKFFRRSGNHIILYPANPRYPTLVFEEGKDEISIQGVVIAHIRVGRRRWAEKRIL